MFALLGTACTQQVEEAPQGGDDPVTTVLGEADIRDTDGTSMGRVSLDFVEDQGIGISVNVSDLSTGPHGFHLHKTGSCDAPDFSNAGGHLNPHDREHGAENPAGKHLGDLPNLVADQEGNAVDRIEIEGSQDALMDALFDDDGTAVMIHADPDDYTTDPTGNAGGRIGCGVLKKAV